MGSRLTQFTLDDSNKKPTARSTCRHCSREVELVLWADAYVRLIPSSTGWLARARAEFVLSITGVSYRQPFVGGSLRISEIGIT